MSRVAVTGATGFIGRHLTAYLAARNVNVLAIVRPSSGRTITQAVGPADRVTVVRAALDVAALQRAFDGVETVVHLAGIVSAAHDREFTAVNVEGTKAVAEAARLAGARLIHVSSLAAAGPAPAARPRSEDDPAAPLTPYGRSKLEGEQVVRESVGLEWTILRPAAVYGPGDRAMLPLFRFARLGILPLTGRQDAAYTFVHVHDVVRAIDAACHSPGGGDTIFVGHPQPATARDILEGIRLAVGRPAVIIPIPSAALGLAAAVLDAIGRATGHPMTLNRPRYAELMSEGFVCCVDRLRDRLGIVAATDLHEGLAATAEWYRREGWL